MSISPGSIDTLHVARMHFLEKHVQEVAPRHVHACTGTEHLTSVSIRLHRQRREKTQRRRSDVYWSYWNDQNASRDYKEVQGCT
jgi:hypothetical protein